MTITATTVIDVPRPTYTNFANTAMAVVGDWLVACSNTGNALLRFHIPTSTPYITKPWYSGSQTLSSCAVWSGHVFFFRGSDGMVYEVDPPTGATTPWASGGYLGAEGRARVPLVGGVAVFGAYGVGGGGPVNATALDLATHSRTVIGSTGSGAGGWYSHSTVDQAGDVWLTRGTLRPWRVDPGSWTMSQPIAGSMRASSAVPFLHDAMVWAGTSTAGNVDQIDPAVPSLALRTGLTGSPAFGMARPSGTVALISTVGGSSSASEMSAVDGVVVDASVALPVAPLAVDWAGDSCWALGGVAYSGVDYVRIVRVDYAPTPPDPHPSRTGFCVGVPVG